MGVLLLLFSCAWVAVTVIRNRTAAARPQVDRLLTIGRPFPPAGRFTGDLYIGPRVCAECHPGEAALHARSGHALTLRPAVRRELARRLDGTTVTDPERPEVRWTYRLRDGHLQLARSEGGRVERWILEYAFGSGHHATTFVTVLDTVTPKILEHRLTYYTAENALNITPGQSKDLEMQGVTDHGVEWPAWNARKCFGCHSTQRAARGDLGIDEETMIPNVTCERCHGPGRAHVEAARRKVSDDALVLPFGPERWTADSLMMLCGTCHRHPSRARPGEIRPDDANLARFQPVGIMQSRCYRESGGSFSCVNCHDPHARASRDRASYNSVCLSCHSGSGPGLGPLATSVPPGALADKVGAPCPTAPGGHCVDCHMPRVDSGQNVLFTDHWIRIRQPGETIARPRTPAPSLDLLEP
jgi:hypothetical protein